jgi:hypothetical protein
MPPLCVRQGYVTKDVILVEYKETSQWLQTSPNCLLRVQVQEVVTVFHEIVYPVIPAVSHTPCVPEGYTIFFKFFRIFLSDNSAEQNSLPCHLVSKEQKITVSGLSVVEIRPVEFLVDVLEITFIVCIGMSKSCTYVLCYWWTPSRLLLRRLHPFCIFFCRGPFLICLVSLKTKVQVHPH